MEKSNPVDEYICFKEDDNLQFAYHYQEGFCKADHYRGLYPVKYTQEAEKHPYQRCEMACTRIDKGKCDKKSSCCVLDSAPEVFPTKDEWKLLYKRYGEN